MAFVAPCQPAFSSQVIRASKAGEGMTCHHAAAVDPPCMHQHGMTGFDGQIQYR